MIHGQLDENSILIIDLSTDTNSQRSVHVNLDISIESSFKSYKILYFPNSENTGHFRNLERTVLEKRFRAFLTLI